MMAEGGARASPLEEWNSHMEKSLPVVEGEEEKEANLEVVVSN